MELKNFLAEFEGLSDEREMTLEKIASHKRPAVIYGAGGYANYMTNKLKSIGVQIYGYAVDSDFYTPNKTFRGLRIYDFQEIAKQSDKYVFVLGMNGARAFDFLEDKSLLHYAVSYPSYQNITLQYLLDNENEFLETFNWLEDDNSKKTMINYCKLHISGNPALANKFEYADGNEQYFNNCTCDAIKKWGGVH